MLISFKREFDRETGENLKDRIVEILNELKKMDVHAVACISDNASNVQLALEKALDEVGLIPCNCLAHTGQLLLKDVCELWSSLFAKANDVEKFFRNTHYARTMYIAEMDRIKGATLLRHPGDTRWGSQVTMMQSVVDNRVCVENTLSALRREGYQSDQFNTLGWVWVRHFWEEMEHLLKLATHLVGYVISAEGNNSTAASSLDSYIRLRDHITEVANDLPTKEAKKVREILASRDNQFFTNWSCLSHLLHPSFRGQALTAPQRRDTIDFLRTKAWQLLCPDSAPPSVSTIQEWIDFTGAFRDASKFTDKEVCPFAFWSVFSDSPLAMVGKCFSCLPSSSASVERVWSSAAFQVNERERLSIDNLGKEVYIRWNVKALDS